MNRGITKENLLFILPPALAHDPSILALAEAAAEALEARLAEIDKARVLSNIDALDEEVLDILAYDFKVDWWDADYTLEEKRRTLKSSWLVHKKLGTKAAVETAISAIYPGTKIEEWFEYGGQPYHFRLLLNAGEIQPDTEKHKKVIERVNYYKSLRSYMDGFIWDFTGPPFIETPGHLVFRRFVLDLTFSNVRGSRFNGALDFGGNDVLFDQGGDGLGFPTFTIAGVRVSHFNSGVRFDGGENFDGDILFDQAYGVMGLNIFRTGGSFSGERERLGGERFAIAVGFAHRNGASFQRFSASAAFRHGERLRGKITMDNLYTLDGSFILDGSKTINAYIKKEEL